MENQLQMNNNVLPKTSNGGQNIAAWMFLLVGLFAEVLSKLTLRTLTTNFIFVCIESVAWAFLVVTASNKATKIAAILIAVSNILPYIIQMIPGGAQCTILFLALRILLIYGFTILLNANANISESDRSWITLIIVICCLWFAIEIFQIYIWAPMANAAWESGEVQIPYFIISFLFECYRVVQAVLMSIALYRTAKCVAFSGVETAEPSAYEVYSPFNKYFMALIVSTVCTVGLLALIYFNYENLNTLLN